MELTEAYDLTRDTLAKYHIRGWSVNFSGVSSWEYAIATFPTKTISLNPQRTSILPQDFVLGRIIHEVAHARLPKNFQHNLIWSRMCREMGGDGKRFVDPHPVEVEHSPWVGNCPVGHLYPGWSDPHPDYVDYCVVCYREGTKIKLDWTSNIA